MRNLDFKREPRDEIFRALISFGASRFPVCLTVVRPALGLNVEAKAFSDQMAVFRLSERAESEWPGTRLLGSTAVVTRYALNPKVGEIIVQSSNGLYDWQQPDLPEDLCILRSDGSPWLTIISHEADAYLTVTREEESELQLHLSELMPYLST